MDFVTHLNSLLLYLIFDICSCLTADPDERPDIDGVSCFQFPPFFNNFSFSIQAALFTGII